MANSLNFDANDLSTYGLVVTGNNIGDFKQQYDSQLIQDISYGFKPKKPPKLIRLEVAILATARATLDGYLDSIRSAIETEDASVLKLDIITDRYWKAKLTTFEGGYKAAGSWEGVMVFQADDPMAYDNTEVSSPHIINATPKTVTETTEGTGYINPVYTLIPGDGYIAGNVIIKNLTTDEELLFTEGPIHSGEIWVIDVANWLVTMDGDVAMSEVTGKFPRLAPGANLIKVTNLYTSVNGSLNIKYQNRYL